MKTRILLFLLIIFSKFTIASDSVLEEFLTNKSRGKISLETIDKQTKNGLKSKIIITDNKKYFINKNTDSIGKINISLPAGTYQIYAISNGYNIHISDYSVVKDSTTMCNIGFDRTQNPKLDIDTTKFYINGFIVDRETNKPLTSVAIIDTKINILATTDSLGYFQFTQDEINKIGFKKHKKSYKLKTINLNIAKPNYDILYLKDYIPIKGLNTVKIFLSKGIGTQKIKFNASCLVNNLKE